MKWAGHVALMGKLRNVYTILVEKLEVKRPLGRPRYRWKDTITWILRKRWYDLDWVQIALEAVLLRTLVNAAVSLRIVGRNALTR